MNISRGWPGRHCSSGRRDDSVVVRKHRRGRQRHGGHLLEQIEASLVPGGAHAVVSDEGINAAGVGRAGGANATAETHRHRFDDQVDHRAGGDAPGRFRKVTLGDFRPRPLPPVLPCRRRECRRDHCSSSAPADERPRRPLRRCPTGVGGGWNAARGSCRQQGCEAASPPGETWRYANVNYVLAGLVVERASGMSYADYVTSRSSPARDARQHRRGGDLRRRRRPRVLVRDTDLRRPTVRQAEMAAGYVISTADDLGRYLAMYLRDGRGENGTRIVSSAGLKTMLTPGPEATLGPWADG